MHKQILFSFKYASEGIVSAFRTERNLRIQCIIGATGFFLGIFFNITITEWLILITLFSLDFSLELTNTAIEEIVDSFTNDVHPAAKRAKDVAAAAVMMAFIAEVIAGLLIFLPLFAQLLTSIS